MTKSDNADLDVVWNTPNVLTMARLVMVPVFIVLTWYGFYGSTSSHWAALIVFIVAAATDHLDGKIARARGLVTNFGKIWDPIADKALTLGAFVVLSLVGMLGWWFTVIVAARELGITWLRSHLLKDGIVVPASFAGKAKTTAQMVLIVFLLFPFSGGVWENTALAVVAWILIAIALWLTLHSAWGYIVGALKRPQR
ncbi:MAG: CDP-diacylglycerol--glycerol-3-phosphate 3-phosphatidyltransferase [Actinomycetaceae bacterium]|nr:CDP-diacylglycerol--glycerol-3-phosphate 3-phosphatidyltransferase [Actinomycetaceae bacterium]